jgi:hypothetical protein
MQLIADDDDGSAERIHREYFDYWAKNFASAALSEQQVDIPNETMERARALFYPEQAPKPHLRLIK